MVEKECCLHPGQPDYHCPECKKEKDTLNKDFDPKKNHEEMLKHIKSKNMRGVPHEIRKHEDEDMPYGT